MSEDIRLAIVVNPALPIGLVANTVSAISVGLGARLPQLAGQTLADREGRAIDTSSRQPVPILAADAEMIGALLLRALGRSDDRAIVPFPAFARSLHDYREYETAFPNCDLSQEAIDGLGLAGPAKWVRSLTGSLKLLR
jgi:hypothetical protein